VTSHSTCFGFGHPTLPSLRETSFPASQRRGFLLSPGCLLPSPHAPFLPENAGCRLVPLLLGLVPSSKQRDLVRPILPPLRTCSRKHAAAPAMTRDTRLPCSCQLTCSAYPGTVNCDIVTS